MPPPAPGVVQFDGSGIYVAPFPAGLSDGWAPYWLTLDTVAAAQGGASNGGLVLPPSTVQQLPAVPMTFQGDADIVIVDFTYTSTNGTVGSTGYPNVGGFNVYPTWGARGWAICSNPAGVPAECLFGTSQMPYRLDRPWLIKGGPMGGVSYINWVFTNTTAATITMAICARGWRRINPGAV